MVRLVKEGGGGEGMVVLRIPAGGGLRHVEHEQDLKKNTTSVYS